MIKQKKQTTIRIFGLRSSTSESDKCVLGAIAMVYIVRWDKNALNAGSQEAEKDDLFDQQH